MSLDRRALLQALAGVSALAASGGADLVMAQGAAAVTPAQFSALSVALTGYPAPDATVTAKVMAAFASRSQRADLARMAQLIAQTPASGWESALQAQGLDRLANQLVNAWYSGTVTTPAGQQLVLFTDAFMWTAMTFAKPMGVCGGPTGYWSQPPQ